MFHSIPNDLVDNRLQEILNDKNSPLSISSRLTSPHNITLNALSRNNNHYTTEIKRKPVLCFNIHAEKHLKNRAIRILDFMCKNLEHRGHQFAFDSYDHTVVIIDTIQIHFNIRQIGKYTTGEKGTYSTREYITTDNLAIQAYEHSYSTKQWADAKIIKLEDKLLRIIAYLEIYAEVEKRQKIIYKEQRRLYDLKLQNEQELLQKRQAEKSKLDELLSFSNDLDKAKKIEIYLNERREYLLTKGLFTNEEKEYYEWGLKKAAWINPLIDEKDDLLDI